MCSLPRGLMIVRHCGTPLKDQFWHGATFVYTRMGTRVLWVTPTAMVLDNSVSGGVKVPIHPSSLVPPSDTKGC